MKSAAGDQVQRKLTQKCSEGLEPTMGTTVTNIYLNEVEYKMFELLGGNEILKYRYVFDFQAYQLGIDVFGGRHEGLILAEVEGESDEALKQLAMPPFVVRDVTADSFFTGAALAIVDVDELRERLLQEAG